MATFLACLMTGPELSAGDGLWGLCIYPLHVGRKLQLHPDRLGLIPAAEPSLFNPVRLGRVCLLTRWNVHEDEGRPSLMQACHWLPGQQGSDCSAKWLHSIWSLRHSMICVITQNNTRYGIESLSYNKANCCISALLDWPTLECWEFFCILDEVSIASTAACSP